MAETTGNTSLFPIFLLSILSLVLIPWTIYKWCCADASESAKLWEPADKKKGWMKRIQSWLTVENVVLVLLWGLMASLVVQVQQTTKDAAQFDPFQILGVTTSSTASEIKKAYFKLSLRYHPDKTSDPSDHKYYTEFVLKAYQALTDPVAKENYEKHGHPDGPQSLDLGIALPEWLFTKDPRVLLALVVVFVLLPLSTMAWYLFRSDEYGGPNNIMRDTLAYYAYSKNRIKEAQGLARIPETLVVAKEFIMMYTPDNHQPALEELRRVMLGCHPELKERPQFWKRKASVVKAHLLFLAHLQRAHSEVPQIFKSGMNFVLEKSIPLLQEMLKIACAPRGSYGGFGWMTPAVACIQCMQCVTQAVPLSIRRPPLPSKKDANEERAAFLQLSGFDEDVVRVLVKKRVRHINHLLEMSESERVTLLSGLDFSAAKIQDVETALMALPTVDVSFEMFVEGEAEIAEGDVVTCRVRLLLSRRSHSTGDVSDSDLRGAGIQCFSPNYPFSREEKWYIMLTWPKQNSVIAWKHVVLKEAEVEALRRGANGSGEELGQVVELHFQAPTEGSFELLLGCHSDCWIGSDKILPHKLKVKKAKKNRSAVRPSKVESDNDEVPAAAPTEETDKGEEEVGSEGPSGDDDEEMTEDEDGYDSEESGELETSTDEEEARVTTDACEQ